MCPRFGNIVIVVGGYNSGKGFQSEDLFGIEGKVIDIGVLKTLVMSILKLSAKTKQELGYDLSSMDMSNPEDVSTLHQIVSDYLELSDKKLNALFKSIIEQPVENKQNLILDDYLVNFIKIANVTWMASQLGYNKRNIHIVFVVNDADSALEQNRNPEVMRSVDEDLLIDVLIGVSTTMRQIVSMGDKVKNYLDGDIWVSFNKVNVNTGTEGSNNGNDGDLEDAFHVRLKKAGGSTLTYDKISSNIIATIREYAPEIVRPMWTV